MAAPTLPQSDLFQRILASSARAEHAFCREPRENQEQERARWWVQFKQELKELLEAMGQVQSPMRIPPFAFAVWQERNRASANPQGDTSIRPHNLVMYGNRRGTEGLFTADTDYRVPHVEGWWQSFGKSFSPHPYIIGLTSCSARVPTPLAPGRDPSTGAGPPGSTYADHFGSHSRRSSFRFIRSTAGVELSSSRSSRTTSSRSSRPAEYPHPPHSSRRPLLAHDSQAAW